MASSQSPMANISRKPSPRPRPGARPLISSASPPMTPIASQNGDWMKTVSTGLRTM